MGGGSKANGERRIVQRKYAPKTRTGCITCKIRRVKCDEAKPACKRCTSTGRTCDGYAAPPSPGSTDTSLASPIPALSADSLTGPLERRAFDYFRARTAPVVAGYFPDAVWDRLVLQMSQSDSTVRYAVNALGSLHEELVLVKNAASKHGPSGLQLQTSFPIVQYSKTLEGMRSLLSADDVSMDLIIMSVLIVIHFEALREAFVPALIHIDNAIRLLTSNTTFNARKIDPHLIRCMVRLDVQGSMYLGMRVPGLAFYTGATDSVLPATLRDIAQARDLVNTWTDRMFHFMRIYGDPHKFREPGDVPLEVIAKSHDLMQTHMDLDKLLWKFLHKPTSRLTTREQHGLSVLRSRVKICRIISACCLYSETTMFDAFLEEYEQILGICMYIMGSQDADKRLFSVSLDEGLLHPLYFVATHCRDSRIRWQAFTQLKRLPPPKRGIWHVEAMIRTAQSCMRFEESCCTANPITCQDIPEWRRIHSAGFDGWDLTSKKPKVTAHLRLRPNGMDGEWADISEVMEWEAEIPMDLEPLYARENLRSPLLQLENGDARMITWP